MSSSLKYSQIKAKLIENGTNLRRWANLRGYKPSTVYAAARRTRRGVVATRIILELTNEL